jgi:hypothetical protein
VRRGTHGRRKNPHCKNQKRGALGLPVFCSVEKITATKSCRNQSYCKKSVVLSLVVRVMMTAVMQRIAVPMIAAIVSRRRIIIRKRTHSGS